MNVEMRTRSTKKEIRDQRPEVGGQRSSDFRRWTSDLGPQTRRRQAAAGFTLLELMTVMVIMFIMMGISTLALRGIMRGAGISGAVANVRSVLTQARSQAIMKQQPTAVFLDQNGITNSMQVIMSFGTVDIPNPSGVEGFSTVRDLPWTAGELDESPVYNFDGEQGGLSVLGGQADSYSSFGSSNITWIAEDQIALAVGTAVNLPQGIAFDPTVSFPVVVQFLPDGSSPGGLSLNLVEPTAADSLPLLIEVQESGLMTIGQPGE